MPCEHGLPRTRFALFLGVNFLVSHHVFGGAVTAAKPAHTVSTAMWYPCVIPKDGALFLTERPLHARSVRRRQTGWQQQGPGPWPCAAFLVAVAAKACRAAIILLL